MQYRTLIVDASHLAYRVYFAYPEGPINYHMVQGFIKSLISANKKYQMEQLIVVWDRGHTYKSQLYPGYKQKTNTMTESQRDDFRLQMGVLEELLLDLGVRCSYKEGIEADDIIAHLCIRGHITLYGTTDIVTILRPILILSSDHDLHPLLTEEVSMWKPNKDTIYTVNSFRNEFDLEPDKYHEVQALMGCSGDKIPGVKGIGPKHALSLIRKYGSLQNIKGAVDMDRILQQVQNSWQDVELSYKLAVFEEVTPVMEAYEVDLARVRKTLFFTGMQSLLESWDNVKGLSEL